MGNWQVTERVRTGLAALAGAVVVSLVAPGVAQAAAANEDSTSNDPSSGAAAGTQAKQKKSSGTPGSPDSSAPDSQPAPPQSAPPQSQPAPPQPAPPSPGAGQAPATQPQPQTQPRRTDLPPNQSTHAPRHRSSANQSAAGSAPSSPARHGRHARLDASGAPAEADRSSAGGAALEQTRAGMPQQSPPALDSLTKLVYTFLPTRTVLDPARTEADALALRDTLVQYWLSQLEQVRKQATDPDAAAEEFVATEWRRFREDPARYVGELRDRMAITAAAEASAEPDADAVTIGDRVAARAQRADQAQQVIHDTRADGRIWGTEITPDSPTDARPDIFDRLPNGQLAITEAKNAVSGVSGAHAAADGPIASAATPAQGW